MPIRMPRILASGLIWLTACAHSPSEAVRIGLPPVPAGLTACTDAPLTPLPGAAGTGWSAEQVAGIIADKIADTKAKARCAFDWRSFYNDLQQQMRVK